MKKLNKKGFTMVELLAVITILGIISGIAIISVSGYLTSTRQKTMENLATTAYDGMLNYMIERNVLLNPNEVYPAGADTNPESNAITLEELYDDGKIDRPTNPYNTAGVCEGYVYAENKNSKTGTIDHGVDTYKVHVYVKCTDEHIVNEVFPKE